MTISSSVRKAGPYPGNGVAASFAFTFKVFADADVLVVRATLATGVELPLVLDTDYTVSRNGDQDTSPGGSVTLTSGALAAIYSLTLASQVPETQEAVFTNTGGFYPSVLNACLDRLTILVQQIGEKVSRSLKVAVSTPSGFDATLPAPVPYGVLGFNSAGTGFQVTDPSGATSIAEDVAEQFADLADTTDSTKGAGMMGFSAALAYTAGSVGFELNKRKSVFATGTAATDVANIQAAISIAADFTTIELLGDFATNATITVKPKIKLLQNYGSITHSNAAADLFAYTPGTPAGYPGRIVFDGLQITGPGNTGTATAIKIDANAPFCQIINCAIDQFKQGAYLRDAYSSVVSNNRITDCSHGIMLYRESHAVDLSNNVVDACTVAGLSVNYGGGAGTGPTHNVNVLGGTYQNSPVGIWAEQCLGLRTVGLYHEGNTVNDYRIGVADAGTYARACYNTKIDGFESSSPCGSDRNVRIEHSVGCEVLGAAWNSGASVTATLLSYDALSDRVTVDVQRHTTTTPTSTAPFDFTAAPSRGVVYFRGRPIYGAGSLDAIQFGTLAAQVGKVYQESVGGREMLTISSTQDIRLMAGALLRLRNSSGGEVMVIDLSTGTLPSSSGAAGTKGVWYDPANSNQLKYVP